MKVTALRDHCAAELQRSFTVDSVVQVAVLADKISHRRLLDDCLAFASCDENRYAWPGTLWLVCFVVSMLSMLQRLSALTGQVGHGCPWCTTKCYTWYASVRGLAYYMSSGALLERPSMQAAFLTLLKRGTGISLT